MATPAPVLNKIALSPLTTGPAQTASPERERIVAAVEFGAVLEELVARSRLHPVSPDAPQTSGPRFPPDLSHRRSPESLLRSALQKLLKLEPTLLGFEQPYDGALPSGEFGIQEKVDALLHAHAQGNGGSQDPETFIPDSDSLDDAILEWDERIVDLVIDSPAVLNGYKVGKALSFTRWQVWAAEHSGGDKPPPESWNEAWNNAFREERIGDIQRHVDTLSGVLDPRAVATVSTSLGYWRNALLKLPEMMDASSPGSPASTTERLIRLPSKRDSEELATALEEQLVNWFDLLTGRRPPEGFPVTGIVTTLTKNLIANRWARIIRFVIPTAAILLLIVALAIAVVSMYVYVTSEGESNLVGGALGTIGTGLGGIVALFVARGRTLFSRGADTVNQLQERIDILEKRLEDQLERTQEVSDQVTATLGLRRVSWRDLGQDVLSNVAEQIRLEELNLAVSEPLVRFVLTRDDKDNGGDPLKEAKRFMELVYGNRSNLDRLQPIFEGLYKFYRNAPQEKG